MDLSEFRFVNPVSIGMSSRASCDVLDTQGLMWEKNDQHNLHPKEW